MKRTHLDRAKPSIAHIAYISNVVGRITVIKNFNALVTCKIKLFQNYFSLRRRPTEIVLCQRVETCLKLFKSYFRNSLQLINIFNLFNVAEIFSSK